MASKKIRKKGEPRLGGSSEIKPPKNSSKSSKKGCFFWVIIFLGLSTAGYYKWDTVGSYVPQVDGLQSSVQGLWGQMFSETEEDEVLEEDSTSQAILEVEPPVMAPVKKKAPVMIAQRGERLQYVRVGNCLTAECRTQLVGEVELMGLPSLVKVVKKRTTYYELVSKQMYSRTKGEAKALSIERHGPAAPPAVLRRKGNRWQVSLGEFPQKRQGVYMKSYIAQLYPDVDLPMVLKPHRRSLAVDYVYAGPFTSRFNAERVVELLRDRRFIQETFMTAKP